MWYETCSLKTTQASHLRASLLWLARQQQPLTEERTKNSPGCRFGKMTCTNRLIPVQYQVPPRMENSQPFKALCCYLTTHTMKRFVLVPNHIFLCSNLLPDASSRIKHTSAQTDLDSTRISTHLNAEQPLVYQPFLICHVL